MAINKKYIPIDNQPTIKPRTVTGLFTKYIPKVIPLAFDESMSYYECLCALLDYINKNVIPALDNNAEGLLELQEFYEELQTYVNDYFKNLDVQEEINNKLDALVEDGILEQIIEHYLNSSAIWGFDNVESMKNATNLINGSFAHTLGYYNKNDGGGATYKIREVTNQDVIDNASIIPLVNEELIAELIVNFNVNIKQFGAYGDNTHDDTNAFKKAIAYLLENNTLYIPYGHYLISDNLKIKDTLSLKGDGGVPYLVYTANSGTLLTIEGHDNRDYQEQEYDYTSENSNAERKYMLENLCLTSDISSGDVRENTVGLAFDTTDYKKIEGSTINNVRIRKFEKGIIFPNRNFYIMTFNNLSLVNNTHGIYLNYNSGYVNAGERITILNSTFDGNSNAITFDELKYDLNIENCSIDYNRCFLNANITRTDSGGKVSIINSHYETNHEIIDDSTPHGFLYGNFPLSAVFIANNIIYSNIKEKLFIKKGSGLACAIYLLNNCFWYTSANGYKYDLNRIFTADDFAITADNNNLGVGHIALPFSPNQLLNKIPGITYLNSSGIATLNSNNHLIDSNNKDTNFIITSPVNISEYSIGDINNISKIYKYIKFKNNTEDQSISFTLQTSELIEFNRNKVFYINIAGKNIKNISYIASWYDDDNNLVVNENKYSLLSDNTIEDTDIVIPRSIKYRPAKNRPKDSKIKFKIYITGIEGKDVDFIGYTVYTA